MPRSKDTSRERLPADVGPYGIVFVRVLAHGVCVGVRMPGPDGPDGHDALFAANAGTRAARPDSDAQDVMIARGLAREEAQHACTLSGLRRPSYIAGRVALRAALARLPGLSGPSGSSMVAIGSTVRGAPITPAGTTGSISHKREIAVGLAARSKTDEPKTDEPKTDERPDEPGGWIIGVDVEAQIPTKRDISRRILTPLELSEIAHLGKAERDLEVILRFSIKEAIYKAIDPFVVRYVGFREVSVQPRADGSVLVRAALVPAPEEPLEIEAVWTEEYGFFLCSARARASGPRP